MSKLIPKGRHHHTGNKPKPVAHIYICRNHRIPIEKTYLEDDPCKHCPRCGRWMHRKEGRDMERQRKKQAIKAKVEDLPGYRSREVWEYLNRVVNGENWVTASHQKIANGMNIPKSTVKYGIRILRDRGLIETKKLKHRSKIIVRKGD